MIINQSKTFENIIADLSKAFDKIIVDLSNTFDVTKSKLSEGFTANSFKTFENFVVDPSNSVAVATAKAVGLNPGEGCKFPYLYLYGPSGLGKTHLLHAIANQIKNNHPDKVICITTAMNFMNEMVKYINDNRIMEFRRKYGEEIDVLIIDDIHSLSNKERTQEELFHIFNMMYETRRQMIFSSVKRPDEIEGLSYRIMTRLQWGVALDIQPPSFETRIEIIKEKLSQLEMSIPQNVIEFIASSIYNNVRELEGALLRLSAYQDHLGVEIDLAIAMDYLKINCTARISLETIAAGVANHFNVKVADLKSPSRVKVIACTRQVAMYLSKKLINATNKEIAIFFNQRHYCSVSHSVSAINKKMKEDKVLAKALRSIESKL